MRADMIDVRIIKDAFLPRFKLVKGEIWTTRKERLTDLGFPVGGGFLESSYYEIICGNEIGEENEIC